VPLRHLERQLLKCLLDRTGEIVRKEELVAALWENAHVSGNTLNVHVRRLRIRLGDTTRPHRLVIAYPRMGFMLAAEPRVSAVPSGRNGLAKVRPLGDRSQFIRDVTVPDGSILAPRERFEKVWEIRNVGSVLWRSRSLRRIGASSGPGRLASDPLIPVPHTGPGQTCLLRAWLTAPTQPGSYFAAWKMVDGIGCECFPRQDALFVSVDVVLAW